MSQAATVAAAPQSREAGDHLMMHAQLPGKVRFAAIDGLRGVACLGVLVFHCWIAFHMPEGPALHLRHHTLGLSQLYSRGFGGVDLFFVLSGFCLSYPLLSKANKPVNWGKYFVARIRRIVPAYWAALFLFGAMSLAVRHKPLQAWFQTDLHWPGIRGFIVDGMLFWKQTLAGPFWTLALEWRWYFVFPLCIWLWRQMGAWAVLAVSVPFSAASVYIKFGLDHPDWIAWSQGVFRYLPLFGFGILGCDLAVSHGRGPVGRFLVRHARWGLLIWAVLLFLTPSYGLDMHSWRATIHRVTIFGPLACFATITAVRDPLVERFFAWAPLVWVGTFSYSLYLIHAPFVLASAWYADHYIHSHVARMLLYLVVVPTAMVLAAFVFFLAFERPFLARKPTVHVATMGKGTAPTPATLPEAAAP